MERESGGSHTATTTTLTTSTSKGIENTNLPLLRKLPSQEVQQVAAAADGDASLQCEEGELPIAWAEPLIEPLLHNELLSEGGEVKNLVTYLCYTQPSQVKPLLLKKDHPPSIRYVPELEAEVGASTQRRKALSCFR